MKTNKNNNTNPKNTIHNGLTQPYDLIVIGGGIAGLYSAYTFLQSFVEDSSKKTHSAIPRILILERNDHMCERWETGRIAGMKVNLGAGVVRKGHDHLVEHLIEQLDVPTSEFTSKIQSAQTLNNFGHDNACEQIDITKVMTLLRYHWKKPQTTFREKYQIRFKEFATNILGNKLYKAFIRQCGYGDFENANPYYALYLYNMTTNLPGNVFLHIDWDILRDKMVEYLKSYNGDGKAHCDGDEVISFKTNHRVIGIMEYPDKFFKVECSLPMTHEGHNRKHYVGKKIVLATRMKETMELLETYVRRTASDSDWQKERWQNQLKPLYKVIRSQPFIRIYAKFDKPSAKILSRLVGHSTTLVPGPLQKILPVSVKKGIYMIAYADNANADYLLHRCGGQRDTPQNRLFLANLVETSLLGDSVGTIGSLFKIESLLIKYWPLCTHYHAPLQDVEEEEKSLMEQFAHSPTTVVRRHLQKPFKGIYVVGEAMSIRNHGWAQGALESVHGLFR